MNQYLRISPAVQQALDNGKPVVALESTIISHGIPYPHNAAIAKKSEQIVRDIGAEPAIIAIWQGKMCVGLSSEELDAFAKKGDQVKRASRRDIPLLLTEGADGATTVAATIAIAALAGIHVFATSAIGGVHMGAESSMDISADLDELAHTPVVVVCSGPNGILNVPLTMEYLETRGVPVVGYGTDILPTFYTNKSGYPVGNRLDNPEAIARAFQIQRSMRFKTGMLVANPIPPDYVMPPDMVDNVVSQAVREAHSKGIFGKNITPFLLNKVSEITGGHSLEASEGLIYNNVELAARIALALAKQ